MGSAASVDNVNRRTPEFWAKREGTRIMQMAAKSGVGGYFSAEIQSAGGGNGPKTVRLWEKWSNSAGWRGATHSNSGISTLGTYIWAGDRAWSNYTVSVRMKSTDNDALGVMFGYQNVSNYYGPLGFWQS